MSTILIRSDPATRQSVGKPSRSAMREEIQLRPSIAGHRLQCGAVRPAGQVTPEPDEVRSPCEHSERSGNIGNGHRLAGSDVDRPTDVAQRQRRQRRSRVGYVHEVAYGVAR